MKFILKPFYINLLSMILLACLGVIVYSNTFFCSFHFDDGMYITNNVAIRDIQNLPNIWKLCPCRFITFLSLAINYHFHGLNVFGYHLFNIAVHLCSAILVWWLTRLTLLTPAMKGNKITRHANLIALLAGLVFVSHPLQTEAVTYIWQRAASMATLFYLASLCFYIKSRLLRGNVIDYICALITTMMAMFTKETAITLPLMILLYEFSFFETKRNLNWRYLSPFLLTLLIIPLTILFNRSERFQEIHRIVDGPGGTSPVHYLLTQFRVMVTYIRLVFFPFNQNMDYDYPIFKNIFEWPVLAGFLFLMIIFIFAKRLFSKYRLVSFSIVWFFLTLLPESSFLPLEDVIFEHRLYLALVGYSMFLVSGVYYLLGKKTLKMAVIVLTVIIASYSVLTYQRNKVWRDDITFWNDAVRKSPHKARTYNYLGLAYYEKKDFTQALAGFTKAIEIDPKLLEAYNNRGDIYAQQGSFAQAISDYSQAIAIGPSLAVLYYNRGLLYSKQGNFTQAINDFTKVIEMKPKFVPAYGSLGISYTNQGKLTQAVSIFTKAIGIDPNYAPAFYNRGMVYYQLKEYDKSRADVCKVQELGVSVDPYFIMLLKKAQGRDK